MTRARCARGGSGAGWGPAAVATVAVVVVVVVTSALHAPPVAALGEGGARSTVVGRGDIVTSILGWARPSGRPRPGTTPPRCAWRTLTDAQLEWLISVAAQAVGLGLRTPLLDPLRPYLGGTELPDGDLQGYVCGVDTYELRFVARTAPRSATEVLYRQMITRLPAPEPVISPPVGVEVPVGAPVFVSIPSVGWQPVRSTLTAAGTTAEVEATPIAVRVITGDPATPTTRCDGPGQPYVPGAGDVAEQARRPGACVTTYRSASGGHRSEREPVAGARPDLWLGTVTVVWTARWRVGSGDWVELGQIPRTRLITRTARDLTTSIESPR